MNPERSLIIIFNETENEKPPPTHARRDNCPIKSKYFQAKFAVKISCIKLDFPFFRAPRPQRRKSRLGLASPRLLSTADGSAGASWPLIGGRRSRDVNTELWLDNAVWARPTCHKLGLSQAVGINYTSFNYKENGMKRVNFFQIIRSQKACRLE